MVVVRISSQLANQMFAYAAVKCISIDHGYEFKYVHEYCSAAEKSHSSADKKYGSNFDTIFPIPPNEKINSVDGLGLKVHEEIDFIKKYDSFFYQDAMNIADNTYMKGHFISPKYFYHRIKEVQKWFTFPNDIDQKMLAQIEELRENNPGKTIVSVHFRVGDDYKLYGFLMDESYWIEAAKKMIEKFENVKFVVLYDRKNKYVTDFMRKYDCEEVHGSLAEDMCYMSKCDAHIIANSTFSMMGALLNHNKNAYVIRPRHYFTGPRTEQKNCFLDSWNIMPSKRNVESKILSSLKIGSIRNKLFNLYYYRKHDMGRIQ